MPDKEVDIKEAISSDAEGKGGGLASEAASQLSDFVNNRRTAGGSDSAAVIANSIEQSLLQNSFKPLSEKERNEAVTQVGKSLDAMVKGDIPHLRERMKELGLSTKELDEVDKKLSEKVEAAKPMEEAILKGDAKSLQKMVATMDQKQLQEITELIQKHFDKTGMGLEVDYADGKLIVSQTNGNRAVAISKDKLDVIGVNADGSYDFSRQFRHENPTKELQGYGDNALSQYLYPPRWEKYMPIRDAKPIDNLYIPNIESIGHSTLKSSK